VIPLSVNAPAHKKKAAFDQSFSISALPGLIYFWFSGIINLLNFFSILTP